MVLKLVSIFLKIKLTFFANLVLNAASVIKGEGIRIWYKDGLWLHKAEMFQLLDFEPNFKMKNTFWEWVFSEIYFKKYTPKMGDVCIDIGSGIGTETLQLSKLVGENGRVYSIEAAKRTFDLLEKNLKINDCENVTALQMAISNNNDPIFISSSVDSHIKNRLSNEASEINIEVETTTMDDFISKYDLPVIDYLKVNIEGAEQLLIQRFTKINLVRNIAISCHDFLGKREGNDWLYTKEIILKFLKENHFEVYFNDTGIDYADDWLFGVNKTLNH